MGDFILTFAGILHIFGISQFPDRTYCQNFLPGLTYLCNNVKIIGGDPHLCYFITNNNDLYYMDFPEQHGLKYTFVSNNVSHKGEYNLAIYDLHFRTLDSINWIYTSDRKISLSCVTQNITCPYLHHGILYTYPNASIIDTDVISNTSYFYIKRKK